MMENEMRSQLRRSTDVSTIEMSGRTKPTVSEDYIVGLTDGEGCFYVNVWKSALYKTGFGIQLHFYIKMQQNDRNVLEKVQNRLGCGATYFQKEQRRNHVQCFRYTVSSQKDIMEVIIPFFLNNPLQSYTKKKNFDIFCRIADVVRNKQHLSKEGVEQILALKATMNQRTAGLA
jgi:hypothetical protein